jgi:hypothetical protein
MKRIFANAKDCDIYKAVAQGEATIDREAYLFIENEIFWPRFKQYLKARFGFEYTLPEGVAYHKHAGDFLTRTDCYVLFDGRVLFWTITEPFLEPDVWEIDAAMLAACMNDWRKLQKMSLFGVIRWCVIKESWENFRRHE